MKLRDLLFTGMDIPKEVRHILLSTEARTINGMTPSEHKAYKMGVENTLNVMKALLTQDEHLVFHLKEHDCMEEFDLDELIEFVADKEGY